MDIKTITIAVGLVLTITSAVYGGVTFVNTRYATNIRVDKIDTRLSINELQDLLDAARRERNFLRDQVRKYPRDQKLKDKLAEIEEEITELKERIRKLRKK